MDRNGDGAHGTALPRVSLSARRAWIEIGYFQRRLSHRRVALRKESVDRNRDGGADTGIAARRSPQGERG